MFMSLVCVHGLAIAQATHVCVCVLVCTYPSDVEVGHIMSYHVFSANGVVAAPGYTNPNPNPNWMGPWLRQDTLGSPGPHRLRRDRGAGLDYERTCPIGLGLGIVAADRDMRVHVQG